MAIDSCQGMYQFTMRIMIVDDEPFNLQSMMIILKAALKQLGQSPDLLDQTVEQANDGEDAIDMVKKLH